MRSILFCLMICLCAPAMAQTTEAVRTVFANPTYHKADFNAEEQFLLSLQPGFPRLGGYFVLTEHSQKNPVYKAGLYPDTTAQLWFGYLRAIAMAHKSNRIDDKIYQIIYPRKEDRLNLLRRNTRLAPEKMEKVAKDSRYFKSRIEDAVTEFDMRRIHEEAKTAFVATQRHTNVKSISVVLISIASLQNYNFGTKRFSFARQPQVRLPGVPHAMAIPRGGEDTENRHYMSFPFPETKAEQLAAVSAQLGASFSTGRVVYLAQFGELQLGSISMENLYKEGSRFVPTGYAVSLDPSFTQVLHLEDFRRGAFDAEEQARAAREANEVAVAQALSQLSLADQGVTAQPAAAAPTLTPAADPMVAAQAATRRMSEPGIDLIGLALMQTEQAAAAHLAESKPTYEGPDLRAGFAQSCVPHFAALDQAVGDFVKASGAQTEQSLTFGQRDELKTLKGALTAEMPDACQNQNENGFVVGYHGQIGGVIDDAITLVHEARAGALVSVGRVLTYPSGTVNIADSQASLIAKYGEGFLQIGQMMVWTSDPRTHLSLKTGAITPQACATQLHIPGDGTDAADISSRRPCGKMVQAELGGQQTTVLLVDTERLHAVNLARIGAEPAASGQGTTKIDF